MEIANKIQTIRKKNGLTQKEFAEKLFVTRQAVTRWESGETTPTIDTLKKMVDIFKVDTCDLLGTICQSCTAELCELDNLGLNKDKSVNIDYCKYCFVDGNLLPVTFDEMMDGYEEYFDNPTPEGKEKFRQQLASLKRWRDNQSKGEFKMNKRDCIACSMPMEKVEDFAGGDTSKNYCFHCAKQDGTMKTYAEVLEGSMAWGMENFTLMGFETQPTETELRKALESHMATLPAWKK
ncbi:MAG: helix-turn-helix domain-containing protein [Firmicutes bacterium]|nr:helix-turn-helix domain-containing protein [Bacillota bacterium]